MAFIKWMENRKTSGTPLANYWQCGFETKTRWSHRKVSMKPWIWAKDTRAALGVGQFGRHSRQNTSWSDPNPHARAQTVTGNATERPGSPSSLKHINSYQVYYSNIHNILVWSSLATCYQERSSDALDIYCGPFVVNQGVTQGFQTACEVKKLMKA